MILAFCISLQDHTQVFHASEHPTAAKDEELAAVPGFLELMPENSVVVPEKMEREDFVLGILGGENPRDKKSTWQDKPVEELITGVNERLDSTPSFLEMQKKNPKVRTRASLSVGTPHPAELT